jgi:hypothetical protein
MTKLKHIGEYIINPDNIAYMRIWDDGMKSIGTELCFNAYASAANETPHVLELLRIYIQGKTPVEIMDFINEEPPF